MNNGIFLFNSETKPLSVFLENLTEDDVSSCCEYKIFLRGFEYYDNHLVKNAEFLPDENKFKALVKGGEKYTVEIIEYNDEILGSCTCPYEGVCKHIVAVLLFISENTLETFVKESDLKNNGEKKPDIWKEYLTSLDKNELIKLVDKYAPKSFRNEINNRNSDNSTALKIFRSVRKNIEELFSDEEMLYSPSDFEASLTGYLEKLKGFEQQLAKEIKGLIIYIIENVDNAFYEGYLYIDNYSYDDYFESEAFCEFVCEFTGRLPFTEKIEFLIRLDESFNNLSYTTFEDIAESFDNMVAESERNQLKDFLIGSSDNLAPSFISKFYDTAGILLNDIEKEKILGKIKENHTGYMIEFCELMIQQNRKDDAFNELIDFLKSNFPDRNERLFSLFLDLSFDLKKNISDASLMAISKCPTSGMLLKIKSLQGTDFIRCKEILEKQNPEELLFYLEKEQLFSEAIEIINKGRLPEYEVFDFFKRNKKHVAPEAEKCFINRIKSNLQFTGDSHYAIIAESLDHLNRINPGTAKKIITEIRLSYKRRTKLMSTLNRF